MHAPGVWTAASPVKIDRHGVPGREWNGRDCNDKPARTENAPHAPTLIEPAELAAHLGDPRCAILDCRSISRARLGRTGLRRRVTCRAPSTRTSIATCPARSRRRTAGIRCPTRAFRGHARPLGHRFATSGGRLRPRQQRLRRPPLVDVEVDGPLGCRRSRRRLRRLAGAGLPVSGEADAQRHASFTARRDDRLAISTVELQSALSSGRGAARSTPAPRIVCGAQRDDRSGCRPCSRRGQSPVHRQRR